MPPVGEDRETLTWITVDLARRRIDPRVIEQILEDITMPIPSLVNEWREEAYEAGYGTAAHEGLVTMLQTRFGTSDERVAGIAERLLAEAGWEDAVRAAVRAGSLDELTAWSAQDE